MIYEGINPNGTFLKDTHFLNMGKLYNKRNTYLGKS